MEINTTLLMAQATVFWGVIDSYIAVLVGLGICLKVASFVIDWKSQKKQSGGENT